MSRCITNQIFIAMSSYRQLLYHVVFRTKNGNPSINQDNAEQLYSYISGIIRNKNSHLYRVNGTENHLHILTDLHPSVALADFMRELKTSTSMWIKEKGLFPNFDGWAEGYGSFTCSYWDLGDLLDYVRNQQEHHKKKSFEDEYRSLILKAGIKIDEKHFP
jgi:REP-associated tyrosine transposase